MGLMEIGLQTADILQNQLTAKQQFERQKKLMDIQNQSQMSMMSQQKANQMDLNKQGQALQMQTWEQTNYPAQVEMLKKAGLNPGLLYSKGGAGGSTGSQGGGSASGGSAASGSAQMAQSTRMMDILSMQSIKAGITTQEAQARKANAEADVIEKYGGGKSEAEIEAQKAGAGKAQAETEVAKVEARIKEIEEANTQREIDTRISNTAALTSKLVQENAITAETRNSIVERTKQEAIGATLENELTRTKTNLTESEIKAIQTGIVQKWTELSQKGRSIEIDQFAKEIQAEYPSAGQVLGAIAKKAYKTLQNIENLFKGGAVPITDKVK
ncbi:MAG: DNA pilot protein [Microviridae sp.]|nr:MAG: DNA pilot protein [Microviridae sp.]